MTALANEGSFILAKRNSHLVHLSSTTQPAEHLPPLMDTLRCAYKLTRPAKGEVSLNLHLRNKSIKPRMRFFVSQVFFPRCFTLHLMFGLVEGDGTKLNKLKRNNVKLLSSAPFIHCVYDVKFYKGC